MAKRRRRKEKAAWMAAVVLVAGILVLLWWMSARRAEAPGLPASRPGARALSAPPEADGHEHDEITGEEKADLERIIRERGAATP